MDPGESADGYLDVALCDGSDGMSGIHARSVGKNSTIEHEETRLGYMSMAVPVFGSSSVLAGALSITAPTVRMNVSRFSGALRTAGLGISRALQAATHSQIPDL